MLIQHVCSARLQYPRSKVVCSRDVPSASLGPMPHSQPVPAVAAQAEWVTYVLRLVMHLQVSFIPSVSLSSLSPFPVFMRVDQVYTASEILRTDPQPVPRVLK